MNSIDIARKAVDHMLSTDEASRSMGMMLEDAGPGQARIKMTIRDDMVNGHKIVHGGILFMLADSAFACACNSYNIVNVASSCQINFIRPAMVGDVLVAIATEENRGKRMGVYDVRIENIEGKLIALFRGNSVSLGRPVFEETA